LFKFPASPQSSSRIWSACDVRRKVPVSVRLDPHVLAWLRSKGQGHLTRINDILTDLMDAERRIGSGR